MFLKRSLVLSVASIATMAVCAHAQDRGADKAAGGSPPAAEAMPSPDAGSSPPAREAAPSQMKGEGTSARDGASGNSSATGEGPERAKQGKVDKPDDKVNNRQAEGDGSKSDAKVRKDDNKTRPEKQSAGSDTPAKSGDNARADRGEDNGGKAGSAEGKGSITQISPEQKTKVKSAFSKHHAKAVTDVDVNIGIGVVVPRSIEFYPVPQDIVVIAPEYRDYLYFVVGNQVCVVDPDTYEIVDIIEIA